MVRKMTLKLSFENKFRAHQHMFLDILLSTDHLLMQDGATFYSPEKENLIYFECIERCQ